MKINFLNLKNYLSILVSFIPKLLDDSKKSNIYFCFDKKVIFFSGMYTNFKVKFDYELEENETDLVENFGVDINTIKTLLADGDCLFYNFKKKIFTDESKGTYKIPTVKYDIDDYFLSFEILEGHNSFIFSREDINEIKTVSRLFRFFDIDNGRFNCVCIDQDNIYITDVVKLYIGKTFNKYDRFYIYKNILTILENLNDLFLKEDIIFYDIDSNYYIDINSGELIIFLCKENVVFDLDVITDEEFVKKYNHNTYFTLDRSELTTALSKLEFFTKHTMNELIYFSFIKQKECIVGFKGLEEEIKIPIPIIETNFESDITFHASRPVIFNVVKTIDSKRLKINISDSSGIINIIGEDNFNRQFILPKISP